MLILSEHLRDGHRRAGELAAALGIDRSTLVRAFEREPELIRLGQARATVYALPAIWSGLDRDRFPIHRVDERGHCHEHGTLVTLAGHETARLPGAVVQAGLPVALHDMAPRGFLGRSFARLHTELLLPEDVTDWSDHHVLHSLTRRGEDMPGNLVIGEQSLERCRKLAVESIPLEGFRAQAEAAMAGEHAGSSAGGEQPKFTAFHEGEHRIVKFASDATDNTRRWQDLLALEYLAGETLRDHGIESADTELIDLDGMRYLIVRRFDRVGARGRLGVMTLAGATIAADRSPNATWTEAASYLDISEEDRERIALLDQFGALIANTDRHLHNIVLFTDNSTYRLAPSFDQLPMAYAPPASGNLRSTPIDLPASASEEAREIARDYWSRARRSTRISDSLREIASAHLSSLSSHP